MRVKFVVVEAKVYNNVIEKGTEGSMQVNNFSGEIGFVSILATANECWNYNNRVAPIKVFI